MSTPLNIVHMILDREATINAYTLLMELWPLATTAEEWRQVAKAIHKSAELSISLDMPLTGQLLVDMAGLAFVRAEMEDEE